MENKIRFLKLGLSVARNNMEYIEKELHQLVNSVSDTLEFIQELDADLEGLREEFLETCPEPSEPDPAPPLEN